MTHAHDWEIIEVEQVGPVVLICECGERRAVEHRSGDDHATRVRAFADRTFTGREVLAITDQLGAGVGATMAAEKSVALRRARDPQPGGTR